MCPGGQEADQEEGPKAVAEAEAVGEAGPLRQMALDRLPYQRSQATQVDSITAAATVLTVFPAVRTLEHRDPTPTRLS